MDSERGYRMRGFVLGLLGVSALLAVPASGVWAADMVQPTPLALIVSGIAYTWTGYTWIADAKQVHPGEDAFWSGGGTGRLSLPLGTNFSIQSDVDVEYNKTLLSDDNASRDLFQASAQF